MPILGTGILLLITHILAGICVGIVFRFWKYNDKEEPSPNGEKLQKRTVPKWANLGEILSNSISKAINSVVMIGGFVVLFSIVISMLNSSGILTFVSTLLIPFFNLIGIDSSFVAPFVSGILELTNGINGIANIMTKNISINIVLVSFLLGFGGFSVLLQVLSITSKTDISIFPYFLGKVLHGSFATLFTYLFIHSFPIFNLDLANTFAANSAVTTNIVSSFWNYGLLTFAILLLISLFCSYKVKCKNS